MPDALDKVLELLEAEIGCLRGLTAQLEEERDALLGGRHEDLVGISEQKLLIGRELADIQAQRRALMGQLAGPGGAPAKLIDLAPHLPVERRGAFKKTVRTISELADRLSSMNQTNRNYVTEALDMVEHLIGVLSGRGRKSAAYNSTGVMADAPPRRMLAREV